MQTADRRRPYAGVLAAALAAAALAVPSAAGALHPVVYGNTFTISGLVPSGKAGQTVQILARPYGAAKYARVGGVTTTANGNWTYTVRPKVSTAYLAVWHGSMTASVTAHVMPRLDLTLRKGLLTVTARAAKSLRGHSVVVQLRRSGKGWRRVRVVVLGRGSRAQVPFSAPRGRSELRLSMSQQQAGAGYIAGYSGVLVYRNTA
jgi:hypothetical protein